MEAHKIDHIFSTNEKDYKAICFFDVLFKLNSIEERFGLHVPVVFEAEEKLYYALCIELNQVTYASALNNAIYRMSRLLCDFVDMSINKESRWEDFWIKNGKMENIYMEIFHNLKEKYNKKRYD